MLVDCGLDLVAYLKTEGHAVRDMVPGQNGRIGFEMDITPEAFETIRRRWITSRERDFLRCYHDLQSMVREFRGEDVRQRRPQRERPSHPKGGELRQRLDIPQSIVAEVTRQNTEVSKASLDEGATPAENEQVAP